MTSIEQRLAALEALHSDSDGWIPWYGGECPLKPGTRHEVRMRVGTESGVTSPHRIWRWVHRGGFDDIIAYRVIQDAENSNSDGWIPWHGGECPLKPGTWHQVRFRNGTSSLMNDFTGSWRWWHDGSPGDVFAYRVIYGAGDTDSDGRIPWQDVIEDPYCFWGIRLTD